MEKPVALTIIGRNKLTTKIRSLILVVLFCMLSVIRPDFEEIKEGRILYNPKDFTRLTLVAFRTFPWDGQ